MSADNAGPADLYRLVYMSRAVSGLTDTDILDILTVARARNFQADVTGLLLYAGGSFIQALEGSKDKIEQIFAAIAQDIRHTWVTVITRETISQRDFPHWSMGFQHRSEMPADARDVFHVSAPALEEKLSAAPPPLKDVILGFTDRVAL